MDDVHRKSGPTLNTVEAQQAQRAQQGSEAAAEGGALSQARRRLQAAEQQHQEEEEEGQQGEQTAHSVGRQRYLFDFEKRPAEYLTFVSGPGGQGACCLCFHCLGLGGMAVKPPMWA